MEHNNNESREHMKPMEKSMPDTAHVRPITDENASIASGGEGEGRGEIGVETICIRCRARVPGRNDTCASCGSGDVTWI